MVQRFISWAFGLSSLAGLLAAPAGLRADETAAAPQVAAGDLWVYERSVRQGPSGFSQSRFDLRAERIDDDAMIVGIKLDGAPGEFEDHAMGRDWSQRRLADGEEVTIGRPLAFPLAIGKSWTLDWVDRKRQGLRLLAEHHEAYSVVGWETVTVPAGTFRALKVVSHDRIKAQFAGAQGASSGGVALPGQSTVIARADRTAPHTGFGREVSTFYYVPQVKYWVKTENEEFDSDDVEIRSVTDVLISFKAAPDVQPEGRSAGPVVPPPPKGLYPPGR